MLPPVSKAALKEWAVVCRALADGRQQLVIRKGGILEVKPGFEVAHRDFWLFPTYVHQQAGDVVQDARRDFAAAQAEQPPAGWVDLALYAAVTDAVQVTELERLRALEGDHILSWDCVASRFHYRNRPGVHVLVLRVLRRPAPVRIPNASWYDGCVSWVELDEPVGTDGLTPVLDEAEFGARRADILRRLGAPPGPNDR
jgi:hypothetical protein